MRASATSLALPSRVRARLIGLFTVRGGKIQSVREYMDTLDARETAF